MPKNLTDNPAAAFGTVTVPVDTDPRNAASVEDPFQQLADRTRFNYERFTENPGAVTLDGSIYQQIRYVGGTHANPHKNAYNEWINVLGGFRSQVNVAQLIYDLTPFLGRFESIVRARVLVKPGAARATVGDRIQITLGGHSYGVSFGSPSGPSFTGHGTETDDGTTDLQWVTFDFSGAPLAVSSLATWLLELTAGVDAGANNDDVYAIVLEVQSDRVGNF